MPDDIGKDIAEGVKGKEREGRTGSSNKNAEKIQNDIDKADKPSPSPTPNPKN